MESFYCLYLEFVVAFKKIVCLVSVLFFLMAGLGHSQSEQDYQSERNNYIALIEDESVSPEKRARAQSLLAGMDYLGLGLKTPDFTSARKGYIAVLSNKSSPEDIKIEAQYWISVMDFLGNGIEKPDDKSARKGFVSILNNKAATEDDKERAREMISKIESQEKESETSKQTSILENLQKMLHNFIYF